MINIKMIHVHYRDMTGEAKGKGQMHIKKLKPTDATSTLMIKKDVATFLNKVKDDVEYYYIVLEIEADGESRFRTITPKIFING